MAGAVMLTAAEGRKQRRAQDRDRAKHLKIQARAKVVELRKAVRAARASKGARIAAARALCKRHRALVIRRGKAREQRLRAELAATIRAEKLAARERCCIGKTQARASALSDVQKAAHALHHERGYQKEIRRIEANNRAAKSNLVRASKRERASESAGTVAANIPPELAPLWKRVQSKIKATSRRSRTEAFLEYAQEHPHEVVEAQEDRIDDTIRTLEKRMNEHQKHARRSRYTAAELAAVPF